MTHRNDVIRYYVVSGGLSVYLDRSRDLSTWEPAKDNGICLQASSDDTQVCSKYVGYIPTASEEQLLSQATSSWQSSGVGGWDVYSSDVDMWDMGDGTTLFFFLAGNQGSTIFAALGSYAGTMRSWFESQF